MRWVAKAKDLPPPQQKPVTAILPLAAGIFFAVVGGGVEVGVDDGGVEAGDGFGGGVHAGEGVGAAAVGAEAGEQVGRDDDEALCGEFVGHLLGPVAEAEDLVDEDDDGRFGFDLGIDDEGLDGAVAVLERDVLVVAGRGVEAGLGPVLRLDGAAARGRSRAAARVRARGKVFVMGRSLVRSVQGRQDERNEFLPCDEECIQR